MKFIAVVGNPPYQGENHFQLYPDFYLFSKKLGENSILIFPTGWQDPKNANNLSKLNKKEVKEDRQIVFIDNRQNVFPGITGAKWTNIILWKKGFDNKLGGKQKILTDGRNPKISNLVFSKKDVVKPKEIVSLANIVCSNKKFKPLSQITSSLRPYGLRTDVLNPKDKKNNPISLMEKYGIPDFKNKKTGNDIKGYDKERGKLIIFYADKNYPFPKKNDRLNKYSILFGENWGSYPKENPISGSYADIVIKEPNAFCTENFIETGAFDDYETAKKHAKYILTKFARALYYYKKTDTHNSKDKWDYVPIQDYSESWWDKSIEEIDNELFKKYKIPDNIKQFVYENIQQRSEANIINFK